LQLAGLTVIGNVKINSVETSIKASYEMVYMARNNVMLSHMQVLSLAPALVA
jgi:hypothetical protein